MTTSSLTERRKNPKRFNALFIDSDGEKQIELIHDGENFSTMLYGIKFSGVNPEELCTELQNIPNEMKGLNILYTYGSWADITNCVISYNDNFKIVKNGQITLCDVFIKHDMMDGRGIDLRVYVNGEHIYESLERANNLESVIEDFRDKLYESTKMYSCAGCAYSDYHPVSAAGSGGCLICYKADKRRYQRLSTNQRGKGSVFGMFYDGHPNYDQVHEFDVCDEFEVRLPDTGYRG